MNLIQTVSLTLFEQGVAKAGGEGRFRRNRAKGRDHRYGYTHALHSAEKDINAVGAEIAAGMVAGIKWKDVTSPDSSGDLGPGVQVRLSHQKPFGLLLIRPETDIDWHKFILVTGNMPVYHIQGWMGVLWARRVGKWDCPSKDKSRPWCWVVRADQMHPMEKFPPMPGLAEHSDLRDLDDDFWLDYPHYERNSPSVQH